MQNNLRNTLWVFLMVVLSWSCKELEKDFNVNNPVAVTVTAASGQQINATLKEVDFNAGDIKEHKDKIKDINLEEITYRVTQFAAASGNSTNPIINGQLEFAPVGSSTFKKNRYYY